MPPQRISREALERIIRRAAELQAGEREIGEGLTRDEVLALGKDVGIPDRYLHQALLEEQTRSPVATAAGPWAWLVGPGTLAAQRVVPGDPAAVERALARWMEDEELLQVKRRQADRTTWEPKVGAFASIQRALGARGRRYALAQAQEVAAQVVQLELGFCHVTLVADVRNQRKGRASGGAVLALVGLAGAAALIAGGAPELAALPIAGFGGGAAATLRSHRGQNERIRVSLEQVLDRLERGEIRAEHRLPGAGASAFVRIADEIRKTLQQI